MSCLFYDYCGALCPCRPDVSKDPDQRNKRHGMMVLEIHKILQAVTQLYAQTSSPWTAGFNEDLCQKICRRKDFIMKALYIAGLNRIQCGTMIEQLLDEAEEVIVADEPPESLLREGLGNYLNACPWKRSEEVEQIIQRIVRVHDKCWTGSWPASKERWHEADASLPPSPETKSGSYVQCKLGQAVNDDQGPEIQEIQRAILSLTDGTIDFRSPKFNPELCAKICRNYENIDKLISYKELPIGDKDKSKWIPLNEYLGPILEGEPLQSLLRESFEKYFGNGLKKENSNIVHLMCKLIKVHSDCLPDFCWIIPADHNTSIMQVGWKISVPFCKDMLEKTDKFDSSRHETDAAVSNKFQPYKETKALLDFADRSLEEWHPSGRSSAGRELARKTQSKIRQEIAKIIVTRQHISKENLDSSIDEMVSNLIPDGTPYEDQIDFSNYLQRAGRRGSGKFGSVFHFLLKLHSNYCEKNKQQEKRKLSNKVGGSTKKKARFEEILSNETL